MYFTYFFIDPRLTWNQVSPCDLYPETWIHPVVRNTSFPRPNRSSLILMLLWPNSFIGQKCSTFKFSSKLIYIFHIGPWCCVSLLHYLTLFLFLPGLFPINIIMKIFPCSVLYTFVPKCFAQVHRHRKSAYYKIFILPNIFY